MNRPLRITLIAAAGIVAAGAIVVGVTLATFDPNSLKPRITEAVQRATGRTLTIAGDIRLRPSLWPTIEVSDVSLSNPPGFSRPQMATLKQMRLSLALLPLLSRDVEIDSLTLVQPDIVLERNAAGQVNWQFASADTPPGTQSTPNVPSEARKRLQIGVHAVHVENGAVAWRDATTGAAVSVGIPNLAASAASPSAPLHLEGAVTYNGVPMTLAADTGGLARLQNSGDASSWPLTVTVTTASAKLTARGTLARPELAQGYDMTVDGTVADTAALAPLLPGSKLPSIHNVSFAFTAVDTGQGRPAIGHFTVHTGPGDLGAGIALDKLDLNAPAADQPVTLDVAAALNGAPFTVTGSVGSPLRQPVPFDLALRVADQPVSLKGSLSSAAGGFGNGAAVHNLAVSGPLIDLTGDLSATLAPRHSIVGTLNASRIDLDGLVGVAGKLSATPRAAEEPTAPGAPPPPPRPASDRIFPDTPLPFDQLRLADADLRMAVGTLRTGGHDYRTIDTHIVLTNGKLTVDPLIGDLPEGHLDGALSVDAGQPTPPVHIRLHAPGLALKTLLETLRQPPVASGNLEVYADLSGTGSSPHAIASTLNGSLGIAIPGGTIDNRLLGSMLGQVMSQVGVLDLVGRGGSSELRCFAARLDAHQGIAAVRSLDLSSSLVTVTGDGTVNLGAETMDLTLRPEARIGGNTVVIPVQVSGPVRRPSARVNEIRSAEANAATVAGAVLGNATPLGAIGGLLGVGRFVGGGDACPTALAAARGGAGAPGSSAPPATPPAARPPDTRPKPPIPNLPDPAKALRNLLR